ncbi:MAG: NADP oxidoreductase, partial [Mycobacterium sp.]
PSGVIGTNKSESQDTVNTLIADLTAAEAREFGPDHATELAEWLATRQPEVVTGEHWKVLDAHERGAGESHGRPRVKLVTVADMLRIAHG